MTATVAMICTGFTLLILSTLAYFAFRKERDIADGYFRGDDDLPDGWC